MSFTSKVGNGTNMSGKPTLIRHRRENDPKRGFDLVR